MTNPNEPQKTVFTPRPQTGLDPARPLCGLLTFLFAGIALGISLYILAFGQGTHAQLHGCTGEDVCNEVIGSRWSVMAGLPIAIYGAGGYTMALILLTLERKTTMMRNSPWTGTLLTLISVTGLGFIAWLTFLQGAVIGHFCVFCMSAHVAGILAFLLILVRFHHRILHLSLPSAALLTGMVVAHILTSDGSLEAAQIQTDELQTAESANLSSGAVQFGKKTNRREASFLDGNLTLDLAQQAVLGSLEAPYVILDLFDYNCPACRRVAGRLKEFQERNPEILVVAVPVVMEKDCNPNLSKNLPMFEGSCELTRLALAVQREAPESFEAFHHWLMEGKRAPSPKEARAEAEKFVDPERLEYTVRSPRIEQTIKDGINIYQFLEGKSLPMLIAGNTRIQSSGYAGKKLYDEIRKAFNLPQGDE